MNKVYTENSKQRALQIYLINVEEKIKTKQNKPSRVGLAFLIQSVKCRTKSKKKSPSGTLMTEITDKSNQHNGW